MIMVIGILIGVIIILLAYIYRFKKEVSNIAEQLEEYNQFKTEKKIDIQLLNKEIERLGKSINTHIELATQLKLKEKKSKDELKSTIANISHDIRTPLTSIIGYIQMLKKRELENEKDREYLNKIEKRAGDLQVLLEEFFMLSVVEEEGYEILLGGVDVKEILCDTLVSFYDDFEKANLEAEVEIEEVGLALGNDKEVKRVIENILSNVLKHSAGEVLISLKEDKEIVLTIANTINDNNEVDVDKIFDRLYKGRDKSRRGKSTGLGLAIVKVLVEKMQGIVEAKIDKKKLYIICKWQSI